MFASASNEGYKKVLEGIEMKTLIHGDNTLMVEFHLEAGAVLPSHSHPHEQTGYLVSGHMTLTIGDRSFPVLPGDSWCIPGDVQHSAEILTPSVAVEVFSPVRKDYIV